MTQVTGSMKSIIHGVSTQSPRERVEGQAWEMLNFIPDTVDGVVRRPGCKHEGAGSFPAGAGTYDWREVSLGGVDYFVGCAAGAMVVIEQETGAKLDVWQAASVAAYFADGMTASTTIGDYAVIASPVLAETTDITGQATRAPAGKAFCMVEVKQGAYGGKYSVVRKSTGASVATFTVPNGGTVTDITQAQPQYIADQLKTGLLGAGLSLAVVAMNGVLTIEGTPAIIADLVVEDGIYNSRMRLLYDFWSDTNSLPAVAPDSLVVRIGNIDRSEGDFYMQFKQHGPEAEYKNPRAGKWVECRAPSGHVGGQFVSTTLPRLMYVGSNGKAYFGTGPEIKAQVLLDTAEVLADLDWGSRTVGDGDTDEDPLFVGRSIKWLGTFQDRLVIVSENAVSMSRISDYLEFYRATIVSILDDDRVNMSSTFNTKDTLTGAELYDRNLIVIGTQTHYVVPGKVPVTPTSGMSVTASFDSAPTVHPVTLGDAVYFCSVSARNADILSITTKDVIDSTQVDSVAKHVDGYIPGDVKRLAASPKLNMLFALSDNGSLYCYRTMFIKRERVLSAWFRFVFGARAGAKLVAIGVDNTVIRLLFTRLDAGTMYYEVASLDLDRKGYLPENEQYYLDFWKVETVPAGSSTFSDARANAVLEDFRVVDLVSNNVKAQAEGRTFELTGGITGALTGQPFEYKFIPTMPIPRDREERPTNIGRLTVTQMQLTYHVGSRFNITVEDSYRTSEREHRAARIGTSTFILGQAYIGSGNVRFPVGSSDIDAKVTISGNGHYPLVLTFLDWRGQYFKHGGNM